MPQAQRLIAGAIEAANYICAKILAIKRVAYYQYYNAISYASRLRGQKVLE